MNRQLKEDVVVTCYCCHDRENVVFHFQRSCERRGGIDQSDRGRQELFYVTIWTRKKENDITTAKVGKSTTIQPLFIACISYDVM